MNQTAYTGISNLYKRMPYLGGLCKLWFIPVEEVDSIPGIDPLTQYLLAEPVLHSEMLWRGPVPVPDAQLGFTETQKNDDRGTYYEIKLQAQSHGDAPQGRVNFDNMAYHRYLVVGKLRAGGFFVLLGSIDSPLDFDNVYSNGPGAAENASTKIAFSGESIQRALVLPSFGGVESGLVSLNTGDGGNNNQTEIIHFTDVDSVTVPWTTTRLSRFGAFPSVELWLLGDDGIHYQAAIQPSIDAAPPDFTEMYFEFPANSTGFIIIK